MERKGTLQRYPSISEWGKGDFSTKVGKKDAAVVVMLSLRKALGIWCQKGPWLKASINLVFLLCSKVSAAAFGTLHISNISLSLAINLSHHSYRMRQKTNSESKLLFSSLEKKSDKSCQCTFCYPTTPCFIDFSGHLLFSPLLGFLMWRTWTDTWGSALSDGQRQKPDGSGDFLLLHQHHHHQCHFHLLFADVSCYPALPA